jgi:hypothetical protein
MNTTIFRIVGIALIVIALVNVVPSLALFGTGTPGPTEDNDAVGVEDESAVEDAIESTGGLTTITGPATLILAPVMVAIGVALLMLKRWEMFAALVLIVDALLKGANLLANIAVPDANASLYVVPVVIMLIDLVLAFLIWQQRNARREGTPAGRETVETRRTV